MTRLFNTLGVSQRAYAVRVSLHHSIVSRCLGGRRVATEDFVECLIREVETKLGTPLQEAARARVREQRLAAVRATDPAEYELEVVRQEAARARRTIARLGREQDALHDRMDRLEAELAAASAELEQQRTDWARDQAASRHRELELRATAAQDRGTREALQAELAQVRADLADVTALRTDAEARCRALEDRVLELEEELGALRAAHGPADPEQALPVEAFLDRLSGHLVADEPREVTRALEAAAWDRSAAEVFRILRWLVDYGALHRAEWLVGLVCDYRCVDFIAELGGRLHTLGREAALDRELLAQVVRTRTPQDLATLYEAWSTGGEGDRGRALLAEAVRAAKGLDLADLLGLIDDSSAIASAVREAARRDFQPRRLFGIARRLAGQGHEALADAVLGALVHQAGTEVGAVTVFARAFGVLLPSQRTDLADRIVATTPSWPQLRLLYALYDIREGGRVADELLARAEAGGVLPALLADAPYPDPAGKPNSVEELRELLRTTYSEALVTDR
ncbi:hypothetical protein [Streptomyces sp. NPDC086023]|uniref:hypothetical protein n=1 Tax=Streptomyces sp. NPDC086023 TaxID=3365746 RepID=UPI0037D03FAE